MTGYILDINTSPDCQKLRNYYLDVYGVNLDNSYINPGYIWIYHIISYQTYDGQAISEQYLFSLYKLDSIVDKNSYVTLTSDFDGYYTYYYANLYTSTGSLIYRLNFEILDTNIYTLSGFDYMICGCGDNAILCGQCCIYCCKIAEATKEYYEKILL